MLRSICSAFRNVAVQTLRHNVVQTSKLLPAKSNFSHLASSANLRNFINTPKNIISPVQNGPLFKEIEKALPLFQQNRTVIKFSMKKGKRKSVKTVTRRFFRLHWGIWIRTISGRKRHLWKKSPARIKRGRRHVFCNATQSRMLDKMVTKYWRKPKYYVDDIYAPYHTREEFSFTRKKPIVREHNK